MLFSTLACSIYLSTLLLAGADKIRLFSLLAQFIARMLKNRPKLFCACYQISSHGTCDTFSIIDLHLFSPKPKTKLKTLPAGKSHSYTYIKALFMD